MDSNKIAAVMVVSVLLVTVGTYVLYGGDDREMKWSDLESVNPEAAEVLSGYTSDLTVRTAAHFAMLDAGLPESMLGDYPSYWDSAALAYGIVGEGDDLDSAATVKDLKDRLRGSEPLKDSLASGTPLISGGLAAPVFPFTDGTADGYTNEDSTIMRFCVYVETEHDMDLDGKRDLVKVFLQVPRSAMEGNYKAPVIFEGRVYSAGSGEGVYEYDSSDFDIEAMYSSPGPRTPVSTADSMEHALASEQSEWYYEDSIGEQMVYERLDSFDDLLVRGYAFAISSGTGTLGSEGLTTNQSDLEMDAYRCVVEWFAGNAVAYTDRTSNIAVTADWCSGDVGAIGRSYAGSSCILLAAMGIENLRTVYEYCGAGGTYNYTNSQGYSMFPGFSYTAWYASECDSVILDAEEWAQVSETHLDYFAKLSELELATIGDFNEEWARREMTDVVSSDTAVMICHGLNDYNVSTDDAYSVYCKFKDAGLETKVVLHQGGHDYLSDAAGDYDLMVDGELSTSLINRWFSYYLFGAENGVTEMPDVLVESADCSSWTAYDAWGGGEMNDYSFPTGTVDLTMSDIDYEEVLYAEQLLDLDTGVYLMDIDASGLVDGRGAFHLSISTEDLGRNQLAVSVYLFDVSDEEFECVDYVFGEADKVTLARGGSWVGGGLANFDLLSFETMTANAKLITHGYADLYNPTATYDPFTCSERTELDGGWYDYTVYLKSTLYEVQEGHHMVAAISTLPVATGYADWIAEDADDYSFTVDLENSWVSIPITED